MSILLDIKNFVADSIGSGDGSTSVPKRDRLINAARRRFYSAHKWSFLKTEGATVSLTSKIGSLPTDFNISFDPFAVYNYSGNYKYQFKKVAWDDLELYGTSDYVYAVDKVNRRIKVSSTDSSVKMDYFYLPADKAIDTSDNTDSEPADDITPIGLLAVAMWYLASRQATGKYQLFNDEYKLELASAIRKDASSHSIRKFNRPIEFETGYRGRS